MNEFLSGTPDGVAIQVKVVPGASRSRIAALLGDRLKVAVAAPAEGGRANQALCALLSEAFGVAPRNVMISNGASQPRKTVVLIGLSLCKAHERLRELLGEG